MPSSSLVQAIVNGQSFSVEAGDISLSLEHDGGHSTGWACAALGPKTLCVPSTMTRATDVL